MTVSGIRICNYFIPRDEVDHVDVDALLEEGAHIYCLQTDDKNESNAVIERLRQNQFTIINSEWENPSGRAFIVLDSNRFTHLQWPDHHFFPTTTFAEIRDNVTRLRLFITSNCDHDAFPLEIPSLPQRIIVKSDLSVTDTPFSDEGKRIFFDFIAPLSGGDLKEETITFLKERSYEQRDGGFLRFRERYQEPDIFERIFFVFSSIRTFVHSIFNLTYVDSMFTLETEASPDNRYQPLFTNITFTERAPLVSQIENWFARLFGCAAQEV